MTRKRLILSTGVTGLFLVLVVRGLGLGQSDPLDSKTQNLGRATGPVPSVAPSAEQVDPPERAVREDDEQERDRTADALAHQKILRGTVQETINASRYTYIQLLSDDGNLLWAAVPQVVVEKGATVSIAESLVMKNFESKTLGRTFPLVIFGVLLSQGAPSAIDAGDGM